MIGRDSEGQYVKGCQWGLILLHKFKGLVVARELIHSKDEYDAAAEPRTQAEQS